MTTRLRSAQWPAPILLITALLCPACLTDFSARPAPDPPCGNGRLDPGEACDDGNRTPGDGCNGACHREPGWECPPTPGACTPICGDDLVVGTETCDGWDTDGVTCRDLDFEGGTLLCAEDCRDVDVSNCWGYCGDGAIGGAEICDGDNLAGVTCLDRGYYRGALACQPDCASYDESSCDQFCGDGLLNGDESCDGSNLNGLNCLTLGTYGGTLGCQTDCRDFDLSACHVVPRILINEVVVNLLGYIELVNRSEVSVDLFGFSLQSFAEADDHTVTVSTLVLPSYDLAPGDRVTLYDSFGAANDPPEVVGDTITFSERFDLAREPAALQLRNEVGTPTDYLRWGGATTPPSGGTAWADTPTPLRTFQSMSWNYALSRLPDGADADIAGDFCITATTPGAPNTAMCESPPSPGAVLITEVDGRTPNQIELHNPGSGAMELLDWGVEAVDHNGNLRTDKLPAFTLAPGAYVTVVADLDSGNASVSHGQIHILRIDWQLGSAGACLLTEPLVGGAIDFLRWGGSTAARRNFSDWQDTPSALPAPTATQNLARWTLSDGDTAADWCLQAATPGSANGSCQ